MKMEKFKPFNKIRRKNLTAYITEKLDGTNASVVVSRELLVGLPYLANVNDCFIYAGSRKRWIEPNSKENKAADNFGFAGWVRDNAEMLVRLGPGQHYGEWVGPGIQKNPHELEERKFYLFNHYRFKDVRPDCCEVVPLLDIGVYSAALIADTMLSLKEQGSHIGGKPEGIMVYVPEADHYQKVTFEHSQGKWKDNEGDTEEY